MSMRIWRVFFPNSGGPRRADDSLGMTYELAYEARVASDSLRFAIKQLDRELTAERQNLALLLLDALDRLTRAERRFRIERVALDRTRPPAGELAAIRDGL
jgi:hypothetical protein